MVDFSHGQGNGWRAAAVEVARENERAWPPAAGHRRAGSGLTERRFAIKLSSPKGDEPRQRYAQVSSRIKGATASSRSRPLFGLMLKRPAVRGLHPLLGLASEVAATDECPDELLQ